MYFIHSITNNILYSWRGSTTLQDNSNTNNFPEVIPKSRINSFFWTLLHIMYHVAENSTILTMTLSTSIQWQLMINESLYRPIQSPWNVLISFLCWGRLGKMLSADIFCPRWSSLIWAAGTLSWLVTWDPHHTYHWFRNLLQSH